MKTELVNISDIQHGDTILVNGQMQTISRNQIKTSPAFGTSIDGNNFLGSGRKVERVLFPKWYKGEIISWVKQI